MTPIHLHIEARVRDFSSSSQLLLLPVSQENDSIENLRYIHPQKIAVLHISSLVTSSHFLPSADVVFVELEKIVRQQNADAKWVVILGLDGLLELWNPENLLATYTEIRNLLDDENLHFIICSTFQNEILNEAFANPRYQGKVVHFHENLEETQWFSPDIKVIDQAFRDWTLEGKTYQGFQSFLRDVEQEEIFASTICIFTEASAYPLANLRENLLQISKKQEFLETFCELSDTLPETQLEWLCSVLNKKCRAILPFLQKHFWGDKLSQEAICSQGPEKMAHCTGAERELLLWTMRKSLSKACYLKEVISDEMVTADNFLRGYVCKAFNLWSSQMAVEYAEERKQALKPIQGLISGDWEYCLERFKRLSDEKVCIWLNCGTRAEKAELLRRYMISEAATLSPIIRKNYPLLDAYMQPYHLGKPELDQYFEDYRLQKLKNTVREDFCEQAQNIAYPPKGIPARAEVLQQFAADSRTLLLSIDALGVEYIPALRKLAKDHSLPIRSATVAYAKLPTCTKFNALEWAGTKKDVKKFDKVLHNGDEDLPLGNDIVGQEKTEFLPQDNIVALLNVLEENIIPVISKELAKYETVILTADHGGSRLAVLAHNAGLDKTLPHFSAESPEDWRYVKTVPGHEPPVGTLATFNNEYWVVKGYNRFGKSGGKRNELHGGLTWEEVLVPVVVFSQDTTFKLNQEVVEQEAFVEDMDFDI